VGSDGESRTVRRDERLKDNATLPAAFINKAGDMMYEKLIEGFEGEVFDAPPPDSSDFLAVSACPFPRSTCLVRSAPYPRVVRLHLFTFPAFPR
jgi:hypothetical protein